MSELSAADLREAMAAHTQTLTPPGGLGPAARAAVAGRRRLRALAAALTAAAAVLAVVVTLPGSARPVTTHGGASTSTCPASALRLQLLPLDRVDDIDYDFAQLRNVGDVACSVAGTVSVSYRDSAGRRVTVAASEADRDDVPGSVTLSPRTPPVDLTPGASSVASANYLEVTLSARATSSGRPCPAAELVTPATIDLTTSGGTVSVANRLTPAPGVYVPPGTTALLRACRGQLSISLKPQG